MVSSTVPIATSEYSWRATADRVGQHGPAPAAADREALEQAGRDIGRTEGEKLLVGVDRLTAFGGERPGGHHVVGVGHDGHAEGRGQQRHQVDPAQVGDGGRGQAAGDVTDRRPRRARRG